MMIMRAALEFSLIRMLEKHQKWCIQHPEVFKFKFATFILPSYFFQKKEELDIFIPFSSYYNIKVFVIDDCIGTHHLIVDAPYNYLDCFKRVELSRIKLGAEPALTQSDMILFDYRELIDIKVKIQF